MKADGSIIIDTKILDDGLEKGFDRLKNEMNAVGTTARSVGATIKRAFSGVAAVFAVKEFISFSREAVQLGSDLQEVQNVVDVTFGELSGAINAFADNAITQFGLSTLAAKQYASTLGAMFKSMGFTTASAAEMSTTLTELAGDLASFYNLSAEDAFAKLRSGISGETEPLKQLGINLSVANLEAYAFSKGIKKAYSAMTQQEQAVLRYNYILSVTSAAQGDFARTSGSWANQTRILSEQFNMLKATIGQGFINALTPVLKVINRVISGLQILANAFYQVTAALFGNTAKISSGTTNKALESVKQSYETAAGGAEELTEETKKAGEAAKRYLAGFDEIEKIGTAENPVFPDADAMEDPFAGVDFGGVSVDTSELEDKISPKIEAIVNKIKEMIEPLKKIDFTPLKETLSALGDSFKGLAGTIGEYFAWAWENVLIPFAQWTIEKGLPAVIHFLAEAFDFLSTVLTALKPLAEWLWDSFLEPIVRWSREFTADALHSLADALNRITEWIQTNKEAVNNMLTLILSITGALSVLAGISKILEFVGAVAALAPEVGVLAAMFPKLSAAIASVVTWITGTLVPAITGAFGAIAAALGVSVGTVIAIGVAVGAAVAAIVIYWDEIKLFFTKTLPGVLDNFTSWLSEKMEQVATWFSDLGKTISEFILEACDSIVEFFTDAAKGIEENIIQPVQNWFLDLKFSIVMAVQNACQSVINWFVTAAKEIDAAFIMPIKEKIAIAAQWITEKFGGAKEKIMEIFRTLPVWFENAIIDPITNFFNGLVRSVVNGFNNIARSVSSALSDLVYWFSELASLMDRTSRRSSRSSSSSSSSSGYAVPSYYAAPEIPQLAKGAVIPPNHKFLAVLGDQTNGTNLEAPESLIRSLFQEELSDIVPAMTAGYEAVIQRQEQILEAILGIDLDGEALSNAVNGYNRKMAMVRGTQ